MKQTEIPLPPTWRDKADKRMLVAEGQYLAEVERLEHSENSRIKVLLRIISSGTELNRTLHETINMESFPEKFYEMLAAAGFDAQATKVTAEDIVGRRLNVVVKHRKGEDGRLWANIVQYRHEPG